MDLYRITADDGNGDITRVTVSRKQLSKMVGDAILETVLASMEIEGESFPSKFQVRLKEPVSLPEALLSTDKPDTRKR